MVSKSVWNHILNTYLFECWIILVLLDCIWKTFLKAGDNFGWRMWCFLRKTYKSFSTVFWHDLCHSLLLPHVADLFIFVIIIKPSSMIIFYMRAFSVVPETNMSFSKSLSIVFELPPQFILQSCSFTRPVTLFTSHCSSITNSCSRTQDLLTFCTYQNTMPWPSFIWSSTTFPLPNHVTTSFQTNSTFLISTNAN